MIDSEIKEAKRLLETLGLEKTNLIRWKKADLVKALEFIQSEYQYLMIKSITKSNTIEMLRQSIRESSILGLVKLRGYFRTLK